MLATSLTPTQADTAPVVDYYRQLQAIEARFRILGDFLCLRPISHWAEQRVRGHVAVCVYPALIETLINHALVAADIRDPDLGIGPEFGGCVGVWLLGEAADLGFQGVGHRSGSEM